MRKENGTQDVGGKDEMSSSMRSRFGQKRNPNFLTSSSSYQASGKKCKLKQEQLIVN
ncbi:hypothetical protein E2320_004959, partial [Naja naja]